MVLGLSAVIFESNLVFHDENLDVFARDPELYVLTVLTPSSNGVHFGGMFLFNGEYAALDDGILYQVRPEVAGEKSPHGRLWRLAGVARFTRIVLHVLVNSPRVVTDRTSHVAIIPDFLGLWLGFCREVSAWNSGYFAVLSALRSRVVCGQALWLLLGRRP